MKTKLILFALLALHLSGCAKFLDRFSRLQGSESLIRFSDARRIAGPALSNGVLVYANKVDDAGNIISVQTIKLNSDTDSTPFRIPQGRYVFSALGFPSGTNALSEIPRCGMSAPYNLPANAPGSEPTDIILSMTTEACAGTVFGDGTFDDGPSDTNGPDPLNFTFCDEQVNVGSFSIVSDNCATNRQQSPSFKSNLTPVGTEVSRVQFEGLSDRFVYIADPYGVKELFSVDASGHFMVRQNSIMGNVSSREVDNYELVINKNNSTSTGQALYTSDAEHNSDNVYQLYITTVGTPGGTMLHTPANSAITSGNGGVRQFQISEDGSFAVFAAKLANGGPTELYAVDLEAGSFSTSSAVKISHSGIVGNGMQTPAGSGSGWDFQILPNSQHVVFAGKFADTNWSELFIVDVLAQLTTLNDANIARISHSSNLHNLYAVTDVRLSRLGNRVFWKGNPCSACTGTYQTRIYGTDLSTPSSPGSPLEISKDFTTPASPKADVNGGYWVSRVSDKIAFQASIDSASNSELWETNFSTWGTFSSVKLDFETVVSGINFGFVSYSPGGTKIAYLKGTSNPPSPSNHKLYKVNSGGGSLLSLSPNVTGIEFSYGGGRENPFTILDENRTFYVGNASANPIRLRSSLMDGSFLEVDVSANGGTAPAAAATVSSSSFGYGKGFFNIDNSNPSTPRSVYQLNIGTSTSANPAGYTRTLLPIGSIMTTATSIHAPPSEFAAMFGAANPLFIGGKRTASSPEDIYILPNFLSASSAPIKLSHLDGGTGSTEGAGRYMVNLIGYRSDANGFLDQGNAISSPCLNLTSNDGNITSDGFKIPYGVAGSTSHLRVAVRIDLFPNADGCGGEHGKKSVLFSRGLANSLVGNSNAKVKLTNNGVSSNLFLAD